VNAKRLQLLKEAVPSVMRVAVIWNPTPSPAALTQLSEMQEAVPVLGVQIQIVEVRTIDAFARALPAALSGHADALLVQERVLALPRAAEIASFALQNRLPSMYRGREFVEAGGLMSYAANSTVGWRRAASFVDRILKGAYPGDLPVEGSPIVQELAINLCTAGRLGITIPASVLTQADVIQCRSR
jgi:putative ABC transport system substrate-binding protein